MVVLKIFWLFWIIFNMERGVACEDYIEEMAEVKEILLSPIRDHEAFVEDEVIDNKPFKFETSYLEDYTQTSQTLNKGKQVLNNESIKINPINNDSTLLGELSLIRSKKDVSSMGKPSEDSVNAEDITVGISLYEGSGDEFEDVYDFHSNSSDEDSILSIWNEDTQNLPNVTVEDIFSTTDSDLKYSENPNGSNEQHSDVIERWIKEKQDESQLNKNQKLNYSIPERKIESKDNKIKQKTDLTNSTSSKNNQPLLNVGKISDYMQLISNTFFNEMTNGNNKTSPLLTLLGRRISFPQILSEIVRAKGNDLKHENLLPVLELLGKLLTGSSAITDATSEVKDVAAHGESIKRSEMATSVSKDNEVEHQDEVKKDNKKMENYKKSKSLLPLESLNNKTLVALEKDTSKQYIEKGYVQMDNSTTFMPEINASRNKSSSTEAISITTEETFSDEMEVINPQSNVEEFSEKPQYDKINSNKTTEMSSSTSETTLTDDNSATNQRKSMFETSETIFNNNTKIFNTSEVIRFDDPLTENQHIPNKIFNTFEATPIDDDLIQNNEDTIIESSTSFLDFEDLEDIIENNKEMLNSYTNKNDIILETEEVEKGIKGLVETSNQFEHYNIPSTTFDPTVQISDDVNQSDNVLDNEAPSTTSLPADTTEFSGQSNSSPANASFLQNNNDDVSVGPHFCGYVCINETLCISLNTSVTLFINNTVIYLPREAVVITGWEAENVNAKMLIEWSNLDNNLLNLSILINLRCRNGNCFAHTVQITLRNNNKATGMQLDNKLKEELVVQRSDLELFRTSFGSVQKNPSVILEFDHGIVLYLSNVSIATYEQEHGIPNFSATSSPFERYYLEILVAACIGSLILGSMIVFLCWMCRKTRNFKLTLSKVE